VPPDFWRRCADGFSAAALLALSWLVERSVAARRSRIGLRSRLETRDPLRLYLLAPPFRLGQTRAGMASSCGDRVRPRKNP